MVQIDYSKVELGKEKSKLKNGKLTRSYEISYEGKNFYFKSDLIEKTKLRYVKKDYNYVRNFKNNEGQNVQKNIQSTTHVITVFKDREEDELGEKIKTDKISSNTDLVNTLNNLKSDLLNRLRAVTKVPDDFSPFKIEMNIHVKNGGHLSRIIDYQSNISDLDPIYLSIILNNCDTCLLVNPEKLVITEKSAYLKVRLSRIFIDNIEDIGNNNNIFGILNNIYRERMDYLDKIKKSESVDKNKKYTSKKEVKNDLLVLIRTKRI